MLSNAALNALIDIRYNIVLIEDFVGGFSFETFEREIKTVYATIRALEIISEASRRLPAELKDRHPKFFGDKCKAPETVIGTTTTVSKLP